MDRMDVFAVRHGGWIALVATGLWRHAARGFGAPGTDDRGGATHVQSWLVVFGDVETERLPVVEAFAGAHAGYYLGLEPSAAAVRQDP